MTKIYAIDLFCGAGGLTHGLIKSDIEVIAGFDIEEECRYPYEANNGGATFFAKDVAKVTGKEILRLYPNDGIKMLAGCAPCQPFSKYSNGVDIQTDSKWPLLYEFARLIKEVAPELVTMENVPTVTSHKVYKDFVADLMKQGYNVWAKTVYCPDYGVPQVRKRHVLLASRIGSVELIAPTHNPKNYRTVRQTIGDLPPLMAGEHLEKDPIHRCAGLSPINLKRIRASKEGGTWLDWPKELRTDCHIKPSGDTYKSVYARMKWDEPSPTMTTQCFGYGNGRFGHPQQDRAISLREAALLQTFPKNYKFVPKNSEIYLVPIGKLIGNAVPVLLGKAIGKSFIYHTQNLRRM
jgi:DNA (cytosine-5)-methyltransferase 1